MHMRGSARRRALTALDSFVRWGGRFLVMFVWGFCAVGYWSVWHYVFIPYMMYTAQETSHILVLTAFHLLVVLCLYSYYSAIRADPGFVLPGYVPPEMEEGRLHSVAAEHDREPGRPSDDVEMTLLGGGAGGDGGDGQPREASDKGKERAWAGSDADSSSSSDHSDDESEGESEGENESESESDDAKPTKAKKKKKKQKAKKTKKTGIEVLEDSNYCKRCASYRPPRAHHCRHCNRCVLRMDHHCPWINNCVGHNNLKYFFLFLFYGAGVGAMFLTLFSFCIYDLFKHSDKYSTEQLWINGITVGFIVWVAAAFTINLTAMGFHTFGLIITNATTIEKMALRARLWGRPRTSNKKLRHRYDLGPQANLRQVMGSSPLQWFFPTAPETDGYHSPTYPNPDGQYELW